MDIKYRLYPHPVLWIENDDYKQSSFDCDITVKRDIKKFVIELQYMLDNPEIEQLIKEGKAEYVVHIECPTTAYRQIVPTNKTKSKWGLKDEDINHKISFCPFIIAKTDIMNFSNRDWDEDYKGITFDYQKGSIIAIGPQQSFSVEKEDIDLGNVPSIFTVIQRETSEELPVTMDINQDKIVIGLNIVDYNRYATLTKFGDTNSIDIVNSCVIYPVLISVLNELKQGLDDYSDYRWFKAIKKIMEQYTDDFNQDYINNQNTFELAQKIMANPVSSALSGMEELIKTTREDY